MEVGIAIRNVRNTGVGFLVDFFCLDVFQVGVLTREREMEFKGPSGRGAPFPGTLLPM